MENNNPINLSSYIKYQPGTVVSKEILQTASGSVTLFAFDKGQGLSEHTTPFEAIVQIMEGEAEITIAGKKHNVSAGEIILMPANVLHALKAEKRFKMLLTMLKSTG